MAATDVIFQGDDTIISITNKDADGNVIDLDTRPGILFFILDDERNILNKYSKDTQAGFDPMTIDVPTSGIFTVMLESAETKTAKEGFISGEVKLEKVDAGFEDSTMHDVAVIENLADIRISKSKDETDLTP